ncbi:hypothetical protein [Viridibacterium curvum]|uniref:FeoB-associated Cys-rich membrane protein n=1 Tax=Viridibacterium curvum TaxID=1101404 RepID=A0ABP9QLS4_9RHOO
MSAASLYSFIEPLLVGLVVLLAAWQLARQFAPRLSRRNPPSGNSCGSCHDSCGNCSSTPPANQPAALIRYPSRPDQT